MRTSRFDDGKADWRIVGAIFALLARMPGEEDFHLAGLARLEAMLHDLIREHATLDGERAQHLADAIRDLRTLIDRLRSEQRQPSDRQDQTATRPRGVTRRDNTRWK
jgi:hypothetical protein